MASEPKIRLAVHAVVPLSSIVRATVQRKGVTMNNLTEYQFGDADKAARKRTADENKRRGRERKNSVPPLKYVRDSQGVMSIHHLPNRSIRRRSAAMERTGYHDMTTGDLVPGWKSKLKTKVRKLNRQREMLTGKVSRPTKFPASSTPPYGSHKVNPNFKLSGRNTLQFSESRKQRRRQQKHE